MTWIEWLMIDAWMECTVPYRDSPRKYHRGGISNENGTIYTPDGGMDDAPDLASSVRRRFSRSRKKAPMVRVVR